MVLFGFCYKIYLHFALVNQTIECRHNNMRIILEVWFPRPHCLNLQSQNPAVQQCGTDIETSVWWQPEGAGWWSLCIYALADKQMYNRMYSRNQAVKPVWTVQRFEGLLFYQITTSAYLIYLSGPVSLSISFQMQILYLDCSPQAQSFVMSII